MTAVTLKNIPTPLHRRLRDQAVRNHRSLNREIIATLEKGLLADPRSARDWLPEIEKLHRKLPQVDHKLTDKFKQQGRA